MKMKKIELTNSFHGTKVSAVVPAEWTNEGNGYCWMQIQQAAYTDVRMRRLERRIRRELCAHGCTCGVVR